MPDQIAHFTAVRDIAVAIGRAAVAVPLEEIDRALEAADRATTLGPIVARSLHLKAAGSLAEQVRFLRAFRDFRAAVEEFRPQ